MRTIEKYRLHDSLGYKLSITSLLQERRLDEGLRPLGLTRITWCVLLAAGNEQKRHPSEIATFVGIDRTATSRALRQMESAGLIARCPGAGDGRTTTVELTETGMELLARGTPFALGNNASMESRLDPDECRELHRLLAKIRSSDDPALSRI